MCVCVCVRGGRCESECVLTVYIDRVIECVCVFVCLTECLCVCMLVHVCAQHYVCCEITNGYFNRDRLCLKV